MHHALSRRIRGVCALLAGAALAPASSWVRLGTCGARCCSRFTAKYRRRTRGPDLRLEPRGDVDGTVSAVEPGNHGTLGLLMRAHTLGPPHKGPETLLRIDTLRGNVEVHLGPTDLVNAR